MKHYTGIVAAYLAPLAFAEQVKQAQGVQPAPRGQVDAAVQGEAKVEFVRTPRVFKPQLNIGTAKAPSKAKTGRQFLRSFIERFDSLLNVETDEVAVGALKALNPDNVEGWVIFIPTQPTQSEEQEKQGRYTIGSTHGPKPLMLEDENGERDRAYIRDEHGNPTHALSYSGMVTAKPVKDVKKGKKEAAA